MMSADRELQEMVIKLRNLQSQADLLNQQLLMTQSSITECERALEAIKILQQSGQDLQLIVPLGAGCYIYVQLSKLDQVMVGTGAGILVNKNPEQATQYLEQRRNQLEQIRDRTSMLLAQVQQQIQELQPKLQEKLGR